MPSIHPIPPAPVRSGTEQASGHPPHAARVHRAAAVPRSIEFATRVLLVLAAIGLAALAIGSGPSTARVCGLLADFPCGP